MATKKVAKAAQAVVEIQKKEIPKKENVVKTVVPVNVLATKPGEPKVETPKKEAPKKAVAKTPKKTTKKEMKVKTFVEYYGKQVEEKEMIARVKKAWTRSGKRVGDIKTMELYIKPEEAAVYYVINGTETGAVAF